MRHDPIMVLAGIAMLSALSGGGMRKEPRLRRYSQFCGPPYPASRQQLRQMRRQAAKAVTRLAATPSETPNDQ